MRIVILALSIVLAVVAAIAVVVRVGSPSASDATVVTSPPVSLADPFQVYDPVRAGENTPPGFRQLLFRDDIAPIYEPRFVSAETSPWTEDSLVIGVEIDGESKAYPVGFLNRREMVIDRLAGVPILVTW